jgi:hypothetical protein
MAITVTAKKNGKPVEPVKTGRKQTAPGKEDPKAANRAAVRAEAAATDWKSKSAPAPQQNPEDTIVPQGNHPNEAVYVARDKKSGAEVSFDQWGRKLDSLGHVVHGDRQRAGDAGAKEIYRPPAPTPPAPVVAKPSPVVGGARSPWDRSMLPKGPPPQPSPGYGIGAGISPELRGNNPNVLAPGGVDPATGQAVPTAFNGMLQPEAAPQSGPAPQPWKPSWDIRPLEDFMSGNSPYSPVAPKVNIPGFGQLPASAADIPMQTGGLDGNPMAMIPGFGGLPQEPGQYAPPRQQQEWIDIPGFGRIPKFR